MKFCSGCGTWKPKENFYKSNRSNDGIRYNCKDCSKMKRKESYNRNKDKIRQYYIKNKEHKKEYDKKYYIKNKNKSKNNNKLYNKRMISYNSKSKYKKEIELYEEIKESSNGNLMCKCAYCGSWFEPTYLQIKNRVNTINGKSRGENRLYCSQNCKDNCPIYGQVLYSKGQKPATSREVQPELRQMVFERDNYTCQKCNTHRDNLEVGIHCHHKEGILWEPLQSADMDMCITLCEDCHKEVHGIDGCGYNEMRCA